MDHFGLDFSIVGKLSIKETVAALIVKEPMFSRYQKQSNQQMETLREGISYAERLMGVRKKILMEKTEIPKKIQILLKDFQKIDIVVFKSKNRRKNKRQKDHKEVDIRL